MDAISEEFLAWAGDASGIGEEWDYIVQPSRRGSCPERASAHVPVEFGQRDGNAGFGEIEDGVWPGKGFPPEACAVPAV